MIKAIREYHHIYRTVSELLAGNVQRVTVQPDISFVSRSIEQITSVFY